MLIWLLPSSEQTTRTTVSAGQSRDAKLIIWPINFILVMIKLSTLELKIIHLERERKKEGKKGKERNGEYRREKALCNVIQPS